ncbi:MAG: type II toxin-antitoxin system PemK/MazF family toxin [Beijerinckiaceae bacterium]
MRRGDVVTVVAAGGYGKPRPAVIVQTDAFSASHASVIVCQMTSELVDAPDFRVTIEPSPRVIQIEGFCANRGPPVRYSLQFNRRRPLD